MIGKNNFLAMLIFLIIGLSLVMESPAYAQVNAWINEFHYDNTGGDLNEFVEIVVPEEFTDLNKLTLTLYNGADGGKYGTHRLNSFVLGDIVTGFKIYTKSISGIQNGSPDGMSLDYNENVIQFISYEGTITATDGPAQGMTSEDIGVSELDPGTPSTYSLQLQGSGTTYDDMTWSGPIFNTRGHPNTDQSLPVELSTFTATTTSESVILNWTTQSEVDNLGFYVLRADSLHGTYQAISPLIPGHGTSTDPHDYTYQDRNVVPQHTYFYQLQQMDFNGQSQLHGPIEVDFLTDSGVEDSGIPNEYGLLYNYPNPFNPGTNLFFNVFGSQTQKVQLTIYDLLGRPVRSLLQERLLSGEQRLYWDGRNDAGWPVPSGHYIGILLIGDHARLSRQLTKVN